MNSLQHRLEVVLNRVISDSAALPQLRPLEGRVVAILVKGLARTVYFSVHDAQVRLAPAPSGQADVSISGTPGAFTRIVRSGFDPSVFSRWQPDTRRRPPKRLPISRLCWAL